VRLRIPSKDCSDCQRPKAGYRCRNAACSVSVMLLEVDSTTLPHPRTPHLMCDARCPFCGQLMVELVPESSGGSYFFLDGRTPRWCDGSMPVVRA
jgi:hypothetical protein